MTCKSSAALSALCDLQRLIFHTLPLLLFSRSWYFYPFDCSCNLRLSAKKREKKKHFSSSDFLLPTLHMRQWAALTPEVKHNYPSLSNGTDNIFSCSIFNKVTTTLFNLIVSIPFINNRQHLIMSFRQYNEDGGGQEKKKSKYLQASGNHSLSKVLK